MTIAPHATVLIDRLGSGPLFVHSDLFRTAPLVNQTRNRSEFLNAHTNLLLEIAKDRGLWMPAFNYDFPRTHIFNLASDPVQLGPLPENFRTKNANWRTSTPIFSASGTGVEPLIPWGDNIDPFGKNSLFAHLIAADGVVLYYGDTFNCSTIIHFAESLVGGGVYRYKKLFGGRVVYPDGESVWGSLSCHVRPLGKNLDYKWTRLQDTAVAAGVCVHLPDFPGLLAASARHLSELFTTELIADPLSLLDHESRVWVEPMLATLGRRFLIGDFESSTLTD